MSKTVLVADDEPNIVAAIRFLLQQSGYAVHTARDGDEALEVIDRVVPDLVILDVMMPKKSGYEVCTRITRDPERRHIKVIMLSAKGRESEVTKGLATGANLYLTKPFSTRELLARVDELLGRDTNTGGMM